MANLTLVVNDDLLRRARIRALERGTSIHAVVREFLEVYSGTAALREGAIEDLLELSRQSKASSAGRKWTREEIHAR